jgi:hypothetical protein
MNDADLMGRLAAANPVADATPGAPAERDRLLAALLREPAPRLRRPAGSRVRPAFVLTTLVAALAVGIVLVAGGSSGQSAAARAYAAVSGDGRIVHLRYEQRYRDEDVAIVQRGESWSLPGRDRFHMVLEDPPGRLWAETAVDGRLVRSYVPAHDVVRVGRLPSGAELVDADPLRRFRVLYRRGQVRETGRTRLRGQDVIRLEARDDDRAPVTYFVDARTHVPVEIRLTLELPQPDFPSRRVHIRILEYERLSLTAENQRLLRLFPHPGARVEQAERSG